MKVCAGRDAVLACKESVVNAIPGGSHGLLVLLCLVLLFFFPPKKQKRLHTGLTLELLLAAKQVVAGQVFTATQSPLRVTSGRKKLLLNSSHQLCLRLPARVTER